jgi:hypothetical protein
MASRHPQMDAFNTAGSHPTEEEVLFNPAEHKDLAHFFSHVDQTETFALTANEWLGIRSGGQQFTPIGSVGPDPGRGNNALASATRSLMSFNTPVAVNNSGSRSQTSLQNSLNNLSLPPLSPAAPSVRAWRPHETPFDPSIHGGSTERGGRSSGVVRRASTSSSSNMVVDHHRSNRDHSADAAGNRKRSAPAPHQESLPSKRARSISNSTAPIQHSNSAPPMSMGAASSSTGAAAAAASTSSASGLPPLSSTLGGPPQVVSSAASSSSAKPPLLTAQQKKANHILSEQKRRAKIRRGYDALCEVVPSLRSAVQAEQEFGDAKRKKGKSTKGTAVDTLDGRAGPKSESIVLSQSTWCHSFLLFLFTVVLIQINKKSLILSRSFLSHFNCKLLSLPLALQPSNIWNTWWPKRRCCLPAYGKRKACFLQATACRMVTLHPYGRKNGMVAQG